MGRTEGPVDPKLAKRRQKNKLASAKCRERKINRAQFLTQEVANMKSEVDEKQNKLDNLFATIENYRQFLKKYEDALTENEKKTIKAMFAPSTSHQVEDDNLRELRDTSTEDSTSTLRESGQCTEDYTEGTDEESLDDSDDETYQPQLDELTSAEQMSTSSNIRI